MTASSPPADSEPKNGPEKRGKRKRRKLVATIILIAHLLGVASSFDALMSTRTPQGAIAWILSLNTVPLVSVPAYWVLGRNKFQGYVTIRREIESTNDERGLELLKRLQGYVARFDEAGAPERAAAAGTRLPFMNGNSVELLIDGEATFDSILAGIDQAQEYVLIQFYIVRDDELGKRLKEKLIEKAKEGVKVWFLYDEVGSGKLGSYVAELREAGVSANAFQSTRGSGNRFQLNFRNHRKIVVVDGTWGWIGGHNVGDEYLGKDPAYPNWRDTHLKITGPVVLQLQLCFVEDWRWATDEVMGFPWKSGRREWLGAGEGATVLIVPTGPADRLESCSLMFQQAIHSAKERIWIASPYFVPDHGVMSALHLAELRGVDVRIIIPEMPDSKLVYYSAYAFVGELLDSGIEIYRYEPGFMHQKAFLVDDRLAGIGTANFDNRSFRLNFEVTALVIDEAFVSEVAKMFDADFAKSRLMTSDEVAEKPTWFKAMSRASYLTAPIQ